MKDPSGINSSIQSVEDLARATSQEYSTRFMVNFLVATVLVVFVIAAFISVKASRRRSAAAPKLPYVVLFLLGLFLLVCAVFWTLCGE